MNRELYCLEEQFSSDLTKHYEGAFTQGSGYLHIRGSYEEGLKAARQDEEYMRLPANVTIEKPRHPRSKWGTYIPGITGIHPLLKEECVNLPNPLVLKVCADGEWLDMDECEIRDYRRVLDMRTGLLTRSFLWNTKKGSRIRCTYERYVSAARKNLIVQTMKYEVVQGNPELRWFGTIDVNVRTNGYNHFSDTQRSVCGSDVFVKVRTDNHDEVSLRSRMCSQKLRFLEEAEGVSASACGRPGEIFTLCKYTVAATSRDGRAIDSKTLAAELSSVIDAKDALWEEHRAIWEQRWQCAGIEIEGDDEAQRAVNFAAYHLLRCPAPEDERVAVCAKGFAGEAYFGHFFWDTEVYLLPFYLYTMPETAKNLAAFRIRTLEGAVRNAREYGYSGAKYPWESSVTGTEQCPNWQYADHEVHVSADVVLGIWHYYCATGDLEFLHRAARVFTETASYWLERTERRSDGTVNLNGVMGPDEYVCLCNNNAYTNYMVRFALERTLDVLNLFADDKTLQKPGEWVEEVRQVINGLAAHERKTGVILQCDGFEALEEPQFDRFWKDRSRAFGTFVSQERNYRSKSLKQADVLMLPYLFPKHFDKEQILENYEYYIPYTTHDSSLSSIVHSIICSRIDRKQEAYDLFRQALCVDLDEKKGGAAEGIHIANCGGICQAVLFGFAGMEFAYEQEELAFHPNLPKHWKSVAFSVVWHKKRYDVRITQSDVSVTEEGV